MGNQDYLGKAVAYPLEIEQGGLRIVTGKNAIESSIIMILMTPVGSRYFLPEYGSNIYKLQYEPNDEPTLRLLRTYIIDAISKWEKRCVPIDVNIVSGEDVAICTVIYRILKSNEVDSFIFPYYLNKKLFS